MDTDAPNSCPEPAKNYRCMPNKLADRRAQGWLRKPGQGWVHSSDYKPSHLSNTMSPEPAQHVVAVCVGGSDTKFKPGESGNVAGRPKGSRNRNSNQLKQRMMESAEGILDAMVDAALAGDTAAAALVVNRVLPPLRPQSEVVQFALDVDQPVSRQVEQVLTAVAKGELAPDVAKKIVEVVQSLAQVRAVEELAQRIEALEAKQI